MAKVTVTTVKNKNTGAKHNLVKVNGTVISDSRKVSTANAKAKTIRNKNK